MNQDTGITQPLFSERNWDGMFLPREHAMDIVTPDRKQVRQAGRMRFHRACDAGVWKRLLAAVLEPANPFDEATPRHVRLEALIIGSLIAGSITLSVLFNLYAALVRSA